MRSFLAYSHLCVLDFYSVLHRFRIHRIHKHLAFMKHHIWNILVKKTNGADNQHHRFTSHSVSVLVCYSVNDKCFKTINWSNDNKPKRKKERKNIWNVFACYTFVKWINSNMNFCYACVCVHLWLFHLLLTIYFTKL